MSVRLSRASKEPNPKEPSGYELIMDVVVNEGISQFRAKTKLT